MTTAFARTSRPVRAVVTVVSGWIVARTVLLWPAAAVVDLEPGQRSVAPPNTAHPLIPADIWEPLPSRVERNSAGDPAALAPIARGQRIEIALDEPTGHDAQLALRSSPILPSKRHASDVAFPRSGPDALPPPPRMASKRLSGSAWALARSTSGSASLANGGQLGGSQAGVRLFYTPGPRAFSLTGRVSTPLASPRGREASVGVALRGRNIGVIVEQRFALDKGGRDAPSVTVYGGLSEVPLGDGVRLDGYVQAGVVGVKDPAGFVDGAVRVEKTVIEEARARLSAGIALSGGAQPGVSRLDIGPQLVARVPVGDTALRVSAEWRQRVAGNAAPGSGPAVTVGFDF